MDDDELSRREIFVLTAMQGLLARRPIARAEDMAILARDAIAVADAVLSELGKTA